ncbi:MAG: methyl-accepting chemotaxis protein [Treponema sp.]|jgi:methyl-accepting chemotaxis protein|nr:methyl-accepting chemotaxis protein [Treponema sp.]
MRNTASANEVSQKRRTSIKRKFVVFSAILFVIIFISGSAAFTLSRWQIVHANVGGELAKSVEIERIKLEASVNGEIAIAMKMAGSPIIQKYFVNPSDSELEKIAFEEIAGYRMAFAGNTVFWVNDVDKKFYSDDAYAFTVDTEDPNNYWYLMTLNETPRYNFNINYNPDLKVTNLWINAPVFDSRRRPVGILGTGIDLTAFVDSIYRGYSGKAAMYLFNTEGEITGAKNASLVANKATLEKELTGIGGEIVNRAKALKKGEVTFFSASGGEEIAVSEVPALGWYIAAVQRITIMDALQSSMTTLFLVMIGVVAAIFVIFYVFISWMLSPLHGMMETLNLVSTNWDLTRQLDVHHDDEIGTLGEYFNLTFGKIKELLKDIKSKAFTLSDTGDELSSHMSKTSADVEGINKSIQGMRGQVLSQADMMNGAANSMEQIIIGLNNLNDHITVQAESVAQSSSAIEEMLANVQSVTQTLVKNTANINSLAESSEAGRVDLQKVASDIQEIARESEGLLEINSVMQNIASQTNLLSMNAAIEAAHAGESGKGFAVVAVEIRKLAENSSVQSKTISAVLKKIKTSIDAITRSTGVVLERFGTIELEVKTVSNQETQIRNAMEEQGVGSRQILEAVTQLNTITSQVRKASSDMIAESKTVQKQSGDLKRITADVAGSMDEMTQNADQISDAIVRVREISQENKENINLLGTEIARFKVE